MLTDTFDLILSGLTAALNGVVFNPGTNYTYNENTGAFATTAGVITVPAATYAQNPTTGEWVVTPGTAVLVVTGTV